MRRPSLLLVLSLATLCSGWALFRRPILPAPDFAPPLADAAPLLSAAPAEATGPRPAGPRASEGALPAEMILVPGGHFTMGTLLKPAEPNEGPTREVTLAPYWVDRTEVTVGAYRACVERGACVAPRVSSRACTYERRDPQLPMNCVGFDEADAYCLAQQKRLLTEAEWEYAARSAPAAPYPWGHDPPGCDRLIAMKGNSTAEGCSPGPQGVGLRPRSKSRHGIDDLAGNVEEWVSDFYDDRLPAEGTTGAPRGSSRVLRGGSWMSPHKATRVTARSWGGGQERGPGVGLRCARDAEPAGRKGSEGSGPVQ